MILESILYAGLLKFSFLLIKNVLKHCLKTKFEKKSFKIFIARVNSVFLIENTQAESQFGNFLWSESIS